MPAFHASVSFKKTAPQVPQRLRNTPEEPLRSSAPSAHTFGYYYYYCYWLLLFLFLLQFSFWDCLLQFLLSFGVLVHLTAQLIGVVAASHARPPAQAPDAQCQHPAPVPLLVVIIIMMFYCVLIVSLFVPTFPILTVIHIVIFITRLLQVSFLFGLLVHFAGRRKT